MLTFDALRMANVYRLQNTPKFKECLTWSRAEWVQALTGELGEAANVSKKISRGDYTLDEKRHDFSHELADVAIYLDLLAFVCDINLEVAIVEKFNDVSQRVSSKARLNHTVGFYLEERNSR